MDRHAHPSLSIKEGDNRSVCNTDFLAIQAQSGDLFTIDACACDNGNNALCDRYFSPSNSFLNVHDLKGQHVWLNAPFNRIADFISHYLAVKAKSPDSTSACILVPQWPGATWGALLQGMKKLTSFPQGYPLFELKAGATKRTSPGIPWPVDIFIDDKYQPLVIKATQSDESPMMMRFHASLNGAKGIIAMDSQASDCFIDQSFVEHHGLVTTPIHRMVELADGSHVRLKAECMVHLRIPVKSSQSVSKHSIRCYVVPLGADHDLILGQNWLIQVGAELSFADKECRLQRDRMVLTTIAPPKATPHTPMRHALLSYAQAKRHARNAVKCFQVQVISDSLKPQAGTAERTKYDPQDFISNIPSHVSPSTRALLIKYHKVFGDRTGPPPDRGIGHLIPEIPGSKPVYVPPYRLSPIEIEEVEKQIKELLLLGLIEPSNSPYGAPILFVKKKDGSLRMCCDWRKLNTQTVKNRYPLPRIDYLLDQLHGASVFTSLDLLQGFNQILIDPADVPKTAFTTPFGHYQYKVMCFGLSNSPATFQAVMNKLLQPLLGKGVLCYMDDILIYAKNPKEHDQLLEQVLQALESNDFYCRLKKCDFEQSELKYLGHLVSAEGIKVDPAKVQVIKDWPQPQSQKDVRSFLGLGNYFRKFVQGYTVLVKPLIELTRKLVRWTPEVWTPACQAAFDGLKEALAKAPVLALPDFTKPFTMEVVCDASLTGIGAVLMQEGRPIAYESRKLTDAEVKWTTTEQELWAVVHALKTWRCYLEGLPFTVVTDHNPNVYFQTQKNLSRRQARWSEYLQRFDFAWSYRPGRNNVADPISRVVPLVLNAITLKAVTTRRQARVTTAPTVAVAEYLPPPPPLRSVSPPPVEAGDDAGLGDSALPGVTVEQSADCPVEFVTPRPVLGDDSLLTEPVTSQGNIIQQLQAGYDTDPWFKTPSNLTSLEFRDGLWWRNNLVVVPDVPGLRRGILYELHDAPYSGHPGISKTLKNVQRLYWWHSVRPDVIDYVKTCANCQRNKASSAKPAGVLHPLPIPHSPWSSVSMDFIVHLPKTSSGYDAIVVFVDRLTKMVHIAPTHTSVTAEGTAELFVDHVFKHHGVPEDIITDRGSVFASHFWSELMRLIGTRHSMSTAWHPQSDGQTERVNRVLEDMLRHYVGSLRHGDWDKCLTAAEFAINNSFHESSGSTPFRLNYGRDPRVPITISHASKFPAPAAFADRVAEGLADAKRCIQAAQQRQKRYYDMFRRDTSFQEGEDVLLSTKNLNLRRTGDKGSTPKLLPKWIGPFKVTKVVGKGAYQLDLPSTLKVHNVFHVSLLKNYRSDGRVQPPDPVVCEDDGEEYFYIDRVLDHRINKRGRRQYKEYLVKWAGYGTEHNSWEPESSLIETDQLKLYWDYVNAAPPAP